MNKSYTEFIFFFTNVAHPHTVLKKMKDKKRFNFYYDKFIKHNSDYAIRSSKNNQ